MKKYPAKKMLAATTLLLFSSMLRAEETLDAELSLGTVNYHINNPSGAFGRYNGISDNTTRLFGGAQLDYSTDSHYLFLDAEDLGLSPARFELGAGSHGIFRFSYGYRTLETLIGADALTPYNGVGSDTLSLPDSFVTAPTTGEMSTLSESLKTIQLKTKRDSSRTTLSYTPTDRWQITLSAYREAREGTTSMGGAIGIPSRWSYPTVILPAPLDEATDNLRIAAGYNTPQYQWEFSYHFSEFKNHYDALTWDIPFDPATAPPGNPYTYSENARTSLAPDNRYQNLSFSGAYNITPVTRLVLSTNYSVMEQDTRLLAYTVNPDSNVSVPLPRASAKTEVENLRAYLKLTTRPLPRLRVNLSYTHNKRTNKTPVALWQRVVNDTADQAVVTPTSDDDGSRATYNRLYNKTEDRLKLSGGYYLGRGTRFTLGYRYENLLRSDRPVKKTKEHSVNAGLSVGRFHSLPSLTLAYKHDRRRAPGEYDAYEEYMAYHTEEYVNSINPAEQFDSHPLLRQFDIADRDRDTLDLTLTFYPANDITLALYGSLVLEDYPHSDLGLGSNDKRSATLDVNYSPHKTLTLFGYYTKEQNHFKLFGRTFHSAGPPGTKAATANDSDNDWQVSSRDDIDTITIGSRFSLLREDLHLRLKGYYSREANELGFATGDNLSAESMPQDRAVLTGAEVEGSYALSNAAKVRISITYEEYDSKNWSRDGIDPGSNDSEDMLALLSSDLDYSATTFYAILTYKW